MKKGLIISAVLIIATGAFIAFSGGAKTIEEQARAGVEEQGSKLVPQQPTAEGQENVGPVLPVFTLEVPDFEFQTTTGDVSTLSEVVQDKPTIVDFWASWCHNCQRNQPVMNELLQGYKDKVNVLAVNMGEDRNTVQNYADDKGYDFITAFDESGIVGRAYGLQYTNTKFLLDGNGKLLHAFSGDIQEKDFQLLTGEITFSEYEQI